MPSHKSPTYAQKSPMYPRKSPVNPQKSPISDTWIYISWTNTTFARTHPHYAVMQERYIRAKESYISTKEPYEFTRGLYRYTKEPYIWYMNLCQLDYRAQTRILSSQKSPVNAQKSPISDTSIYVSWTTFARTHTHSVVSKERYKCTKEPYIWYMNLCQLDYRAQTRILSSQKSAINAQKSPISDISIYVSWTSHTHIQSLKKQTLSWM